MAVVNPDGTLNDPRMPRPMAWYRTVVDEGGESSLLYGYLLSPAEVVALASPDPTQFMKPDLRAVLRRIDRAAARMAAKDDPTLYDQGRRDAFEACARMVRDALDDEAREAALDDSARGQVWPTIDTDRLAVAMNTAQVTCEEIRVGHDLRVPAARIAAAYR